MRTNGSRGLSGTIAFVQKFHVDISIIIFFSFTHFCFFFGSFTFFCFFATFCDFIWHFFFVGHKKFALLLTHDWVAEVGGGAGGLKMEAGYRVWAVNVGKANPLSPIWPLSLLKSISFRGCCLFAYWWGWRNLFELRGNGGKWKMWNVKSKIYVPKWGSVCGAEKRVSKLNDKTHVCGIMPHITPFPFFAFSIGDNTCALMLSPQAKNAKQLKKYSKQFFTATAKSRHNAPTHQPPPRRSATPIWIWLVCLFVLRP